MKAIFIAFDQAHKETIIDLLEKNNGRGFTSFGETQGRGTIKGEPHFGTHAWPSLGGAILSIVDDSKVETILELLRNLDNSKPRLGLRAFAWNIEQSV